MRIRKESNMSYPKNKKLLVCDKCGAEKDMLIRVKVQKRLAIFEESYCAECVVLPVYRDEYSSDVFRRCNHIS
jgi:hypothetical protein